MNNLPLILLGGLSAAFFLTKKKSSLEIFPSESPFKVTETKFPGYEFKNNKLVVTDEIKALTYVNKVATTRVKDYDRISHSCNTKNKMCSQIVESDWIYYLGLDLFGFLRTNRLYAEGYINKSISESNIIKFGNKFKEYLKSDPDLFNYLVLNYIKYQVLSDYKPSILYHGTDIPTYYKYTPEVLLEWYGNYLIKLNLKQYTPTNKEIEFVFST